MKAGNIQQNMSLCSSLTSFKLMYQIYQALIQISFLTRMIITNGYRIMRLCNLKEESMSQSAGLSRRVVMW